MFVDKPSPGSFYMGMLIGLMVLVTGVPLCQVGLFAQPAIIKPILALMFLAPMVIFIIIIHAGFNTVYKLNENSLDLKCGWIMKGSYLYKDIQAITLSRFNGKVLGVGYGQKGYCNRFTNGLCLQIGKEKVYISPSENDRFWFELEAKTQHAQKSQAG